MLIAISALGPAAMQMFLPALPVIQREFDVSAGTAQLALSLAMLSMAVCTLGYGPLSDRFGRKPVILASLVVFLAGTLLCALATGVATLIVGRVVQAGGAVAGLVLARAAVRDRYGRDESASMLAYVTMAMVLAPMLSPSIGGALTDGLGWRTMFVGMGVAGVVLIPLVWRHFPETRVPTVGPALRMLPAMGMLLRSALFRAYVLQSTFTMCMFFSFISAVPYLMVNVLGRSPTEYGLWFMLVAGSYMVGNFVSGRITQRVGIDRMMLVGSTLSLLGAVTLAAAVIGLPWSPAVLFVPAGLISIAHGLALPSAQAGAVSVDTALAGTASGLASFLQMTVSALAAQLVGLLLNDTPYPMVAFVLGAGVLAWGFALVPWRLARNARSVPPA